MLFRSAARHAIASPLLEVNIAGAQGILFNITGSSSLSLFEVTEAAEEIKAAADPEANIIFGTSFNDRLGDEVMITVIATGFDGKARRDHHRRESQAHHPADMATRQPRERDFMDELERQRTQTGSGADQDASRTESDEAAALAPVPMERSVGQPVPVVKRTAYDADDLEIPSFLRRK